MRFVSVRDLRGRPGDVWKMLDREGEVVVTSHGKPIAILTPTSEEMLEASLSAIRRARAVEALAELQLESVRKGTDRLTPREIEREIRSVRRKRRS